MRYIHLVASALLILSGCGRSELPASSDGSSNGSGGDAQGGGSTGSSTSATGSGGAAPSCDESACASQPTLDCAAHACVDGSCQYLWKPNGTDCILYGNPGLCEQGQCQPVCNPHACTHPQGSCYEDATCDAVTNACSAPVPLPAGVSCPDGVGTCDGNGHCMGGDTGACGAVAFRLCSDKANACVPGTACYDFKACYENVQGDDAAILACVQANPTGSRQWMHIVQCECRCGWAPVGFCDGSDFGHISG